MENEEDESHVHKRRRLNSSMPTCYQTPVGDGNGTFQDRSELVVSLDKPISLTPLPPRLVVASVETPVNPPTAAVVCTASSVLSESQPAHVATSTTSTATSTSISNMSQTELRLAIRESQIRKSIPFGWLAHDKYSIKYVCPLESLHVPSDCSGAFGLSYSQYSLLPVTPAEASSSSVATPKLTNSALCTALAFVIYTSKNARVCFTTESKMNSSLLQIMKFGFFLWTLFERATVMTECYRQIANEQLQMWPVKRLHHPPRIAQKVLFTKDGIPHSTLMNHIVRDIGFCCEAQTQASQSSLDRIFLEQLQPHYIEGLHRAQTILASHDLDSIIKSSIFLHGTLPDVNQPFTTIPLEVEPWDYFANILKKIRVIRASFRLWQHSDESDQGSFVYNCHALAAFYECIQLKRSNGISESLAWVTECANDVFGDMPYLTMILLDENTSASHLLTALEQAIMGFPDKKHLPQWLRYAAHGDFKQPRLLRRILNPQSSIAARVRNAIGLWKLLVIQAIVFPTTPTTENVMPDPFVASVANLNLLLRFETQTLDPAAVLPLRSKLDELRKEVFWAPITSLGAIGIDTTPPKWQTVLPLTLTELVHLINHIRHEDQACIRSCIIRLTNEISFTIGVCWHKDQKSILPDHTQLVYYMFDSLPVTQQRGGCFSATTDPKAFVQMLSLHHGLRTRYMPRMTIVKLTSHFEHVVRHLQQQYQSVACMP